MAAIKSQPTGMAVFILIILGSVLTGSVLTGCAGKSQSARFYLLHPIEETHVTRRDATETRPVSVMIGPITIPTYLDRPQLVIRSSDNLMELAEFHRWAEPVKDNFYRVITDNLSILLDTPDIEPYDRQGAMDARHQIIIDVTQFVCTQDGYARLDVFWKLVDPGSKSIMVRRKSRYRSDTAVEGFPGMVQAQNRILNDFCRDVASAVNPFLVK